jgi:hypothetical protein
VQAVAAITAAAIRGSMSKEIMGVQSSGLGER